MNRNAADGIFMVPLSSDLRPLGAPKELMTSTVGDGLAWTVDGRDVIAGAVSNSGGGTRTTYGELRPMGPARHSAFLWGMSAAVPLCPRGRRARLRL